jgi:hypothetical protein
MSGLVKIASRASDEQQELLTLFAEFKRFCMRSPSVPDVISKGVPIREPQLHIYRLLKLDSQLTRN